MADRLKVLVSAYACSPVRGSEPGMGWGFVAELSKFHDLWVIVEKEKFQLEIESSLNCYPEIQKHVKFFFIQKKRHRILRKIWPPSYYWFYKTWQREAYSLAQKLHQEIHFDIVHQLNMVGFREPGYLWHLDIPFVWGPIGGFVQMPLKFSRLLGPTGFLHYSGRNLFNKLQILFLSRPRKAATKAKTGLISATSDTALAIEKVWNKNNHIICEVGVPVIQDKVCTSRDEKDPLKIVWSGLHIPRKALPILLFALARVADTVKWQLDILGKGTETLRWQKMADNLKISGSCCWHGWLPRKKSLEIMENGHLFVVTSLQDLTSTVIIEAISLGLPVVCLDHCGFKDVVTAECGIKIPVTSPDDVIDNMASAIMTLANDEELRQRMAKNALKRANDFCWGNKIDMLNEIYIKRIAEQSNENSDGS